MRSSASRLFSCYSLIMGCSTALKTSLMWYKYRTLNAQRGNNGKQKACKLTFHSSVCSLQSSASVRWLLLPQNPAAKVQLGRARSWPICFPVQSSAPTCPAGSYASAVKIRFGSETMIPGDHVCNKLMRNTRVKKHVGMWRATRWSGHLTDTYRG